MSTEVSLGAYDVLEQSAEYQQILGTLIVFISIDAKLVHSLRNIFYSCSHNFILFIGLSQPYTYLTPLVSQSVTSAPWVASASHIYLKYR